MQLRRSRSKTSVTELRQDMGDTEAENGVTGPTGTGWGAMAYEVSCEYSS